MLSARVAGDHVGERVAGAVDGGAAGQRQVLDVRRQREGHRALHQIGAAAGRLDDAVADVVHHVGVVAGAAGQRIGAGAAVERVVIGAAIERVVAGAAIECVVAGAADERVDAGTGGDDIVAVAAVDQRPNSLRAPEMSIVSAPFVTYTLVIDTMPVPLAPPESATVYWKLAGPAAPAV